MIDRTLFAAQGLVGGKAGALGGLNAEAQPLRPKMVHRLDGQAHVTFTLPGGGGYGDPFARDPQRVFDDVVNGYTSIEAALRDYGVAIRYLGRPDQLVRLPEHYMIDEAETGRVRRFMQPRV